MINTKPTVVGGVFEGKHLDDFEYCDEDIDTWHTILNTTLTEVIYGFAYVWVNMEINK